MMPPPVMAPKAKDVTAEPIGKPALTIVFSEARFCVGLSSFLELSYEWNVCKSAINLACPSGV